ncbi:MULTISPECIES: hypothetical protein [unclassified Polaromonas]|jgi:hypothetical protein|uniref:hypothetical protein n=1 Tax=unclassified Polaromonas TaxID=2638319 RepID=UPI0025E54E56|nr:MULTISPECIES: hypothetical protein [unclassified Polaromonas]
MKVEIVGVSNRGNASREFVHLQAIEDCDLRFYMVADSSYVDPQHISNKLRNHFWFPAAQVKAKEHIILCTGVGVNNTTNSNGMTIHWFYWGLHRPVWNDGGDTAVLFELQGWTSKSVPSGGLRLAA